MSILDLQNVSITFGETVALNQVSLSLQDAEFLVILGPTGAGKTTLFDALAGNLTVDGGEIYLNGLPIHTLSPHRICRTGLSRTFQIPRPFPEMSVLENVMMVPTGQSGETFWNNWLQPGKVAREEIAARERAKEIIEFCGLTRVRGDQAGTLSGGQLKLLELARVMMAEPKIILLDEPAAGVNPSLMVTLVDKIKALNEQGFTFLIIEHNMDVVMSICDPIMVMAQGSLLYSGNAKGARNDPKVLDAYLGGLP